MMFIQEKEISRIFNTRNWSIALNFHSRDIIEMLDIEYDKDHQSYVIYALVEQFIYSNEVNIHLSQDGLITFYDCDCSYCNEEVACAHIGAVLLYLNELIPPSIPYHYDAKESREKALKDWIIQRQLEASKSFLDQYKRVSEGEFQANLLSTKIKLNAYLKMNTEIPNIQFKIGYEKFYVIKNLMNFLDDIEEKNNVYYGKALSFFHHIDAFDDTTKLIIQFLQRYRQTHNNDWEYNYTNKRELPLDSIIFDDFFDLYSNEAVDYIDCEFSMDEIETLPLHFEKDNIGYILTTPLNVENIFQGKAYWYYYDTECFTRFHKDIYDKCSALIKQLKANRQMVIAKEDMTDFCTYVYRQIEDCVELDGDSIEEFFQQDEELTCYVDMNDQGDVSIRIKVQRNHTTYSLFDEDLVSSLYIDRAKTIVNTYINVIDQDSKIAYINANSPEIYSFLKDGLPYLNSFCTVYVSDTINQLNHPKSVSFQVGIRLENNLLQIDVNSVHIPQEELYGVLKSYRRKKKYHRLKNGEMIYLEQENIEEISDLMDQFHIQANDFNDGSIQLPSYHSFAMDDLSNSIQHAEITRSALFEETMEQMHHISHNAFTLPDNYADILRDYQVFGYQWIKTMSAYGFGGILADDMGLGKTLQMIAVLEDEKQKDPNNVSIIVTPASLIFNWQDEIEKFSKHLRCLCIHGSASQRTSLIQQLSDYDIIVTSYDYLRRDHELYEHINFHYIVLDEAQYIKNHTTKNATTVKTLKGTHRFALTGTPIENSLAELWSIFDFLMPGYLYNYHFFRKRYEREIVKYHNEKAQEKLKHLVEPFILRREKKEVLTELPDKIERVQYLEFDEEEEKIYMANLVQINAELQAKLNMEGFDKFQILAMMTRLRQICCDPRLLYENIEKPSSKLEGCMELIASAKATNKKVLLFSSFTSLLDLIEDELIDQHMSYRKLTGETSKELRRQYVQEFQDKQVDVFLISLKAGGTGLNLTAAEVVIHFDPWWNMSAQNQATDRAYRIGQTQNVQVYKLIMKNSIEEKILKLQETKMNLSNTFTQGSEGSITSMKEEEIMSLFQ